MHTDCFSGYSKTPQDPFKALTTLKCLFNLRFYCCNAPYSIKFLKRLSFYFSFLFSSSKKVKIKPMEKHRVYLANKLSTVLRACLSSQSINGKFICVLALDNLFALISYQRSRALGALLGYVMVLLVLPRAQLKICTHKTEMLD